MFCVYFVENTVDGSSMIVPTCYLTRFYNPRDHEINSIGNIIQGHYKFSNINLCLKKAVSANSTDSDGCVAMLRKCNVMGQTVQSIERNCVTKCGLWHIRRICKAQQPITGTCQQAKLNLCKCQFLKLVIIYVAVFWNVMSRVLIAICRSFELNIHPYVSAHQWNLRKSFCAKYQ